MMSRLEKSSSAHPRSKLAHSGGQSQFSRSWAKFRNESEAWKKGLMRSKNQNQSSDEPHVLRGAFRQALLFWLFWSAYVCLSAILITALLTNWPKFLHPLSRLFRY